jgi:hypothetical protein
MRNFDQTDDSLRVSPLAQVVLAAAAIALLSTLVLAKSPENTRLWVEIFNAGHAPLFGVVAVIALILSANWLGTQFNHHFDHYVSSLFICAVLGVVTEVIQGQIGRDADPYDVLRDVVGAGSFLLLAGTIDPAYKSRAIISRMLSRYGLRLLAVLFLAGTSGSAIIWGAAYVERDVRFPVICDYGSYLSSLFLAPEYASIDAVNPPPGWTGPPGYKVCKITFDMSTYPGLTINEPYPDWTGYSRLSFDVYSALKASAELSIRVHDIRHNWELTDRFTRTVRIAPGMNRISIPLADIQNAPVGRQMDMKAIRQIIIFAASPPEPFSLYLGPLRLS